MKSALENAIDSKVSVSVEPSSIEISGLTDDAKNALVDVPSADKLTLGELKVSLGDIETLLKRMKEQATTLENFAANTGSLSDAAGEIPALIKGVSDLNSGAKNLTAPTFYTQNASCRRTVL